MKNTISVKSLRDSGCKVRVTHVRRLHSPMVVGAADSADGGLDWFGSKREFENHSNCLNLEWGQAVDPFGGFTVVEITDAEGKTYRGKFSFGLRQFVRSIGLKAALGRALKAMEKQSNKAELCGC